MQEQARFHSVLYDRGDLEDNVMKEILGANIKFAHRHFQLSSKIGPVFRIAPINHWTFLPLKLRQIFSGFPVVPFDFAYHFAQPHFFAIFYYNNIGRNISICKI